MVDKLKQITWAQRKEMLRTIDDYGGMLKISDTRTLPVDFIELALKHGYGLGEDELNAMSYEDLVTKSMVVLETFFLNPVQEKKS